MPKSDPTWIVVMDSAQARVFELRTGSQGRELKLALPVMEAGLKRFSKDERSDKPGRSFSPGGGVRHAIEPKHDYHKLAKHKFANDVAGAIEEGASAQRFDRLILVAPRRSIGELRTLLPDKVRARIVHEIAKDFAKDTAQAIWSRIAPVVSPIGVPVTVKPTNGSKRASSIGVVKPIVLFRELRPSTAIEASVLKHARKLNRVHEQITSCKAVVQGSHGHHHKGPLYRVDVDLRLPGRTIAATSAKGTAHAHEDVYAAIRDAFAAAGRQMQDHLRHKAGGGNQVERSSSLRGRRADAV